MAAAVGLALTASCGGTAVVDSCEPGETRPCLGPGACDGQQSCEVDGYSWSECECGGGGTGGTGGTSTGTGGTGGTPTGTGGTTTGTGGTGGTPTGTGGTGGTNPCTGQVALGLGETPACQDCIAQSCCPQYQQCVSGGVCDPLFECALPDSYCGFDCFYEICDSGVGYVLYKDCADCLGTNCCSEIKDCFANNACTNCLTNGSQGQACDQTTLDENVDNCQVTNCDLTCGYYY